MSANIPKLYKISADLPSGHVSKILTEKEYDSLSQKGTFNGRSFSVIGSLFKAFKHTSAKDYFKDLSLPLVFNIAMKLDSVALNAIKSQYFSGIQNDAIIKTIIWINCIAADVLTLPARLIISALNAFFNKDSASSHPLSKLLMNAGANKKDFESIKNLDLKTESFSKIAAHGNAYTTCAYKRSEISLVPGESTYAPELYEYFNGFELFNYHLSQFNVTLSAAELQQKNIDDATSLGITYNEELEFSVTLLKSLIKYLPEKSKKLDIEESNLTSMSIQDRVKGIKKLFKFFSIKYHPDKQPTKKAIFDEIQQEMSKFNKCYDMKS